jgi:hypothetical protein
MLTPFENGPDETPDASNRGGDGARHQRRASSEVDCSVHRSPFGLAYEDVRVCTLQHHRLSSVTRSVTSESSSNISGELRRTPYIRSSQNSLSTRLVE